MPITSLANSPYAWIFGISIASSIPFITLIRKCTVDLVESRNKKLNNINDGSDTKLIFIEMFEIYRKFKRHDSLITYSFWSFIGIVVSSISGIICQYFELNSFYATPSLILSGIIFFINFIPLLWWYVKH